MDAKATATELSRSSAFLAGLLCQIARNDERSLTELYNHTRHIVYGLVLGVLREQSAAEDITQEIYIQIWRKAAAFDPARGSALGWIVTVSRRRALDKLRSSKSRLSRDTGGLELDNFYSPNPNP